MDRADAWLAGGGGMSTVYLQGTLHVSANTPKVLQMHCRTYSGLCQQFSLFAVQVDAFRTD
ncbi:hypothetical protein [Caballeronia sp. M23-90]